MDEKKPLIIIAPNSMLQDYKHAEAIRQIESKLTDSKVFIVSEEDWKEKPDNIIIDDAQYLKLDDGYNVISEKSQGEFPIIDGGRNLSKTRKVAIAANVLGDNASVVHVQSEKSKEMMYPKHKVTALLGAVLLSSTLNNNNVEADPQFVDKKDIKPKGNRFVIEGVEIYALNRKNAERKYKNMKKNGRSDK